MNALTIVMPTAMANLPVVTWQAAIEPFLTTLNSPQTRRAYRAELVARLDAYGPQAVIPCNCGVETSCLARVSQILLADRLNTPDQRSNCLHTQITTRHSG